MQINIIKKKDSSKKIEDVMRDGDAEEQRRYAEERAREERKRIFIKIFTEPLISDIVVTRGPNGELPPDPFHDTYRAAQALLDLSRSEGEKKGGKKQTRKRSKKHSNKHSNRKRKTRRSG